MTIFSSLFRRRRHPVNPIQRPDSDSALLARIDQRLAQTDAQQEALGRIERQLARTGAQVDFLNNHTASYLGDGTALTHLVDETPFFINSNDYGSPMNFLSGGRYEEDNLAVLLSFVDDSTVFVDVGANLGFFSLRVAQRLRGGSGKVLAFEPQASVMELMRRTLHLNALTRYVETYPFALSDRAGFTSFDVPIGHLGGGQIRPGVTERWHGALTVPVETREIELRVFDDLVPEDFRCDLVKIDVEGHELSVLRGMRRSLQRSPNAVVLFEKMVRDHGSERAMWNLFGELGMRLYGVGDEAMLIPLASPQALIEWDRGYAFAARDPALLERPGRRRFRMGARQLRIRDGARWHGTGRETLAEIASDGVLSFGPYWSLGRGHWRVRIDGEFNRTIEVIIKERVGTLEIARIRLQPGILTAEFHCDHDLVEFECVLHAIDQQLTELRLAGIDLERADGSVAPPVTGTSAIEVVDLAARETMLRLPELPPPRDEARYTSPRAQPRFTVFSNCQGEVFAAAIQAFMGGRMPSIHAVHQFALDQPKFLVEPLRELARHHDAILTQPGLAVKIEPLLPELAGRIQRFPKLSFPAFHPDCCYVYRSEGEILDGVLGPYQSSIVYQAWRVGMSAGETLDLFRDEVYETLLFHDYWEASAHGLLAEGRAANLPLDGLLERWRMQGCFMHTHNHPKAAVIVDVARATLLRMGYELPAIEPADFLHDALGSGPVWPVYPEIAARLGIAWELSVQSQQRQSGRSHHSASVRS